METPIQLEVFQTTGPKPIKVFYAKEQDGGGTVFGWEYVEVIKNKYPKKCFKRCYEWCSGPGFIGYSILSHGLCQSLCLSDLYDPSVTSAENTSTHPENNCRNDVSIYLLKDIALLPASEKFDLVVSNPPHFGATDYRFYNDEYQMNRICTDQDWKAHKNFFKHIKSHLLPEGVILLQENMVGSTVETFKPFIEEAGLVITDTFKSKKFFGIEPILEIYYIEIKSR